MRYTPALLALAATLTTVLAKTDLAGCTSSATVKDGGYYAIWWVAETGEICQGIDCGGGRAPPKKDVPGCAAYTGTLEYEPSYMPGWGPDGKTGGEVKETSVKNVEAEETTKVAQQEKPEVTKPVAQPVVTPGPDAVVSTVGSEDGPDAVVSTVGSEDEEGMMTTMAEGITSAPSMPKATGTGMVTSKIATSVVLDSESGNSTSGNKTSGNGTAPETGAASQAKVGYTFMGAMALLAAVAI